MYVNTMVKLLTFSARQVCDVGLTAVGASPGDVFDSRRSRHGSTPAFV